MNSIYQPCSKSWQKLPTEVESVHTVEFHINDLMTLSKLGNWVRRTDMITSNSYDESRPTVILIFKERIIGLSKHYTDNLDESRAICHGSGAHPRAQCSWCIDVWFRREIHCGCPLKKWPFRHGPIRSNEQSLQVYVHSYLGVEHKTLGITMYNLFRKIWALSWTGSTQLRNFIFLCHDAR